MSTQYNGAPGNLTLPSSVLSVNNASNVSPIQITTSTAHGMTTGDVVDVYNVQGNTAANGRWVANVQSSLTFELYFANGTASTGNGAYTSGGSALPRSFGSTFAIPSDGDAEDAASVNVSLQVLADRSAWSSTSFGGAAGAPSFMLWQHSTSFLADPSFDDTLCALSTTTSFAQMASPTLLKWEIDALNVGDYVDVTFTAGSAQKGSSDPLQILGLAYAPFAPGASVPAFTLIGGSNMLIGAISSGLLQPTLQALVKLTGTPWGAGISGGSIMLSAVGASFSSTGTLTLVGDYTMKAKIWRPVSV